MSKHPYSIYHYNNYGLSVIPHVDDDSEIYFDVYAHKRVKGKYTKKMKIIKISENPNKCSVRWFNLEFYRLSGWIVKFPGDKYSYLGGEYDRWKMIKTPYDKLPGISDIKISYLGDIEKLDPSLKYLVKALELNGEYLTMELIKAYRTNPLDVELLIKSGQKRLATNKNMLRLKADVKKKVFREILKGNVDQAITSKELICNVKYGLNTNVYKYIKKYNINLSKAKKYLLKNEESLYIDYLIMANNTGKNLNDDYWAFPKNLQDRHDKILIENNNQKAAEFHDVFSNIKSLSEKLRKKYKPMIVNGYQIDFPNDIGDIIHQADVLNQCLISAKYHSKYQKKQLMLVFIKKDSLPVATVEINKNLTIGQFYGDEFDRNNCLPSPDVKYAFNIWYDQFMKNKIKQGVNNQA